MAISFIQEATTVNGNAAPVQLTWSSNVTAGSGLFILVNYVHNGIVGSSVTDSVGTSYTLVKRVTPTGAVDGANELWFGNAPTGGANVTTVNFTGGKVGIAVCGLEFSPGAGLQFAVDQSASTQQTGTTTLSHGSITTTQNDELIVTLARINNGFSVSVFPTGFTQRVSSMFLALCMTRIVSATLTTDAAATTAANEESSALIASFSLEEPPPAPPRFTQLVQSLVAKLPGSPELVTQILWSLVTTQAGGRRFTQVLRTVIVELTPPPEEQCPDRPVIGELVEGSLEVTPAEPEEPPVCEGTPPTVTTLAAGSLEVTPETPATPPDCDGTPPTIGSVH